MARGEKSLQVKACAQWGKRTFDGIVASFEAATQALAMNFENVEDLAGASGLKIVLDYVMGEGASPWVAYALGEADKGALFLSVNDPVTWYVVTHKSPCSGARITTGGSAQKAAEALGVALAAPAIRQKNPDLSADTLNEFVSALEAQKMRGLSPVRDALVKGFTDGVKMWDSEPAASAGARHVRAMQMRQAKLKSKFKQAGIDASEPDTPSGVVAVLAGGAAGGLLAGPVGALAGGAVGFVASQFKSEET